MLRDDDESSADWPICVCFRWRNLCLDLLNVISWHSIKKFEHWLNFEDTLPGCLCFFPLPGIDFTFFFLSHEYRANSTSPIAERNFYYSKHIYVVFQSVINSNYDGATSSCARISLFHCLRYICFFAIFQICI